MLFSLLMLATFAGPVCGGDSARSSGDNVQSPVEGLLREVIGSDTGEPHSITLETDAGDTLEFTVELLEPGSVDVTHLQLHIDQAMPVSVSFSGDGEDRVAYRIDDAPP
jgi:hypothetical protein